MSNNTLIINSNIEEINNVYEWVKSKLDENLSKKLCNNILLITQEIVSNAIIHGNENILSKKVVIKFLIDGKNIVISIEDEGKGCPSFPTKEEALELDYLSEGGRGLKLAVLMCDDIEINKNLITLIFKNKDKE